MGGSINDVQISTSSPGRWLIYVTVAGKTIRYFKSYSWGGDLEFHLLALGL